MLRMRRHARRGRHECRAGVGTAAHSAGEDIDFAPVAIVLVGWPAIITSIILVMTGIASRQWSWALTGVVVAVPFLLYLWATPRFGTIAVPTALLYFASVWAAARGRRRMAVALTVPFVSMAALVARLVLQSSR
jgi:hypothetical protein